MPRRDLTGAIDFRRLDAYAAGDRELVDEVLALFEEQAAAWLGRLDGAADGAAFRDAAHTLRGSALGLCADALAEACGRAEAQADAGPGLRGALADRVRREVDRVLADVAARRRERPPSFPEPSGTDGTGTPSP